MSYGVDSPIIHQKGCESSKSNFPLIVFLFDSWQSYYTMFTFFILKSGETDQILTFKK